MTESELEFGSVWFSLRCSVDVAGSSRTQQSLAKNWLQANRSELRELARDVGQAARTSLSGPRLLLESSGRASLVETERELAGPSFKPLKRGANPANGSSRR